MSDQTSIPVLVKLEFGEVYLASVVLTARMLRKVLYIFGTMAALTLALVFSALLHPQPEAEWYHTLQRSGPLLWVFGIPVLYVFVLPLLSAKKVLSGERIKNGVQYQFSESGVHVKSSVATADLQWSAFRDAIETRSAFLLLVGSIRAHTIPKRCFADNNEIAQMRHLLHVSLPNAKLRPS